jgi:hypothetical protein
MGIWDIYGGKIIPFSKKNQISAPQCLAAIGMKASALKAAGLGKLP